MINPTTVLARTPNSILILHSASIASNIMNCLFRLILVKYKEFNI